MGQSCTAGSRILVHEEVYDAFCGLFQKCVEQIKVGDPLDGETFQGAQVSKVGRESVVVPPSSLLTFSPSFRPCHLQAQFDKIMGYIEDGKTTARVLAGGK
jgi:acyl-CoA reductase-like NAD-dependent aldehyde dehydrogenase